MIFAILAQSMGMVDLRFREDAMFTVFKGWDKFGCKFYEIDKKYQKILMSWKIGSNKLTDYNARKHAFIIDRGNQGTFINFDLDDEYYKNLPFEFQYVSGVSRAKEQKRVLIDYVCTLNLDEYSDKKIRAKLYDTLEEMESEIECFVKPSDFSEIIIRARDKYESTVKKKPSIKLKEPKTKLERIKTCFSVRKEKILHLTDISSMTKLNLNHISMTIYNNINDFKGIGKGYWCLTSNLPSRRELIYFMKERGLIKTPMKKLKSDEKIKAEG